MDAADFPAIYKAMNGNGLRTGSRADLKERDMDEEYAKAARAALDEYMACMRAMNDNRKARQVLDRSSATVPEVLRGRHGEAGVA